MSFETPRNPKVNQLNFLEEFAKRFLKKMNVALLASRKKRGLNL